MLRCTPTSARPRQPERRRL